jgi:hypothetical protein
METQNANSYLFLRGLRQADHTVFTVENGQKRYWDPQFEKRVPFSSGQQVKRSILDWFSERMGEDRSPVTFNHKVNKDDKLEQKEPWSACNPRYADQLIGGWMRAGGSVSVKRRSPLSISAMRPLHPLLSSMSKEGISFNRSDDKSGKHEVRVLNAKGDEMSTEEIDEFLESDDRTLPRRSYIPADWDKTARASGLFVYDIAVDLSRLFRVTLDRHEPALESDKIEELRENGWEESDDGLDIICPAERREQIIPALAHSLVHWRITSNQSRTYSPQATLALAISDDASRVTGVIRADLQEHADEQKAKPVIEKVDGVEVYTMPACKSHITGVTASADALDEAVSDIEEHLRAYDYA